MIFIHVYACFQPKITVAIGNRLKINSKVFCFMTFCGILNTCIIEFKKQSIINPEGPKVISICQSTSLEPSQSAHPYSLTMVFSVGWPTFNFHLDIHKVVNRQSLNLRWEYSLYPLRNSTCLGLISPAMKLQMYKSLMVFFPFQTLAWK